MCIRDRDYVTNGFPTVGIRMPDDPFVLRLIKECGKPLLVTSANRSGEETGVRDEQVLEQLDGRIDAIVLGEAKGKLASTIVDMSEEEPRIVREGPISADDIKRVLHNASVSYTHLGKITGIHGKSGSGKSTLLKLIMRFWNVSQGSISVHGVDLKDINTSDLRNMQSLVDVYKRQS